MLGGGRGQKDAISCIDLHPRADRMQHMIDLTWVAHIRLSQGQKVSSLRFGVGGGIYSPLLRNGEERLL